MFKPYTLLFSGIAAILLLVLASGCISKPAPSTVYILEPLPVGNTAIQPAHETTGMVMVMPVRLPPQLRQNSIVVEESGSVPQVLVGHLWAGPLDEQIGANLAANLQTLLASPNVTLYPGPRYSKARYQVETEIIRFSGDTRQFILRAVTTISDPGQRRIISRKAFDKTINIEGNGYGAYVAAASKALGFLSRDIAATLASPMNGKSK